MTDRARAGARDGRAEEHAPGFVLEPARPWFGPHRPVLSAVARPVIEFFRIEATGGLVLVLAAAAALIWANVAAASARGQPRR